MSTDSREAAGAARPMCSRVAPSTRLMSRVTGMRTAKVAMTLWIMEITALPQPLK